MSNAYKTILQASSVTSSQLFSPYANRFLLIIFFVIAASFFSGNKGKDIHYNLPTFIVHTSVVPQTVLPKQTVEVITTVQAVSKTKALILLGIIDPSFNEVLSAAKQKNPEGLIKNFSPGEVATYTTHWQVPSSAMVGKYVVKEAIRSEDGFTDYFTKNAMTSFTVVNHPTEIISK